MTFYILSPFILLIVILLLIIPRIIKDKNKKLSNDNSEVSKRIRTEKELFKFYNNLSLLWGGLGIFVRIVYFAVLVSVFNYAYEYNESIVAAGHIGEFLLGISGILLVIGIFYYLKTKGRSAWWCLLGFTPLIICIPVLLLLKSKPLSVSEKKIIYDK